MHWIAVSTPVSCVRVVSLDPVRSGDSVTRVAKFSAQETETPWAAQQIEAGRQETNLADLLPHDPCSRNHSLRVSRLPQRPGETLSAPLLEADSHAEVLYTAAEEELIAK